MTCFFCNFRHKDSDKNLQTSFAELEKVKNENNLLKVENRNLNQRVIDLGKVGIISTTSKIVNKK